MKPNDTSLNLMIIGSGGDGVMSTANMLMLTASQIGLFGVMIQSYGPQIRGGESAAHVTVQNRPTECVNHTKDIVVCFRFHDAMRFTQEFDIGNTSILIHSAEESDIPEFLQKSARAPIGIPFKSVLKESELPDIAKNVFVYGLLLRTLGWPMESGKQCVQNVFGHKSSAVISSNIRALELGYNYIKEIDIPIQNDLTLSKRNREVITGNEACARAAVAAGCKFYAGYPITPSSEILETMYELLPKAGGKVMQAEDEISAIGMLVGASYGGLASMTATSGPGLSLMTEILGLSSIAEIPLVIVDCQRAGPSTGLPSKTEQSDLWHSMYGGHGDFPRVLLAPTSAKDCFETIFRAFYCAENYQLPVIVLSDALIAQRSEIIDAVETASFPKFKRLTAEPEGDYLRFDLNSFLSENGCGVSAVAIPGTPCGMHSIAGIEHTEKGTPSAEGLNHEKMNQKRFKKMEAIAKESADWVTITGQIEAPHALIAWGSTRGAVEELIARRPDLALFVPAILNPFPVEALKNFLKGRKSVTVVEMNFQGQLFHHLKAIGAIPEQSVSACRSGGIPFQVDEIERMLPKEASL